MLLSYFFCVFNYYIAIIKSYAINDPFNVVIFFSFFFIPLNSLTLLKIGDLPGEGSIHEVIKTQYPLIKSKASKKLWYYHLCIYDHIFNNFFIIVIKEYFSKDISYCGMLSFSIVIMKKTDYH